MTFDQWYFSKVGVTVEGAMERGVYDIDLMAQCWEAAVKQAREDAQADLSEALMHDCENGVKFLNEKAIEESRAAVPAGWVRVPIEPSNEMTSAMATAIEDPENERSSWDLAENMYRAMLAAAPQPVAQPGEPLLDCDVAPRPLSYPLKDYHHSPSDGPLHYTWQDKPHLIVYDLIAVRYYAQAKPEQAAQPIPHHPV